MTPDAPDQHGRPSKKHRRSLSLSMMPRGKVVDLTSDGPSETGSSRKHDRNDQDTHVEGPSKRPKTESGSEPPMSKDKNMSPKAKRKKKRGEVNHRKVPRTSNHQKLKEEVRALELELQDTKQKQCETQQELKERIRSLETDLANSKQTNEATQQELEDLKQESLDNVQFLQHELKAAKQKQCEAQQELKERIRSFESDLTNSKQTNEATKQELEDLKQYSSESIDYLERELVKSRQAHGGTETDLASTKEQLKVKDGRLQSIISKLEDANEFAKLQFEEVRKQQLTIKAEREEIQHLKAQANDTASNLQELHQSCQQKDGELKIKDERIAASEKGLDDSKAQCAGLEKTISETKAALKTAQSNQANFCNELMRTSEKLRSMEQELDEAKTAREKAEEEAEALHRVNEAHVRRNHGARTREQKAKETLKSVRSEKDVLEDRRNELQTKLKDQESERNQTVGRLQEKLIAYRKQSQRYNYKEPDEKIKKDFASLEARIRQFADGYTKPVRAATDQDLKTLWPNWSPRLPDFLAFPLLCGLVFEAYVWDYLHTRIFSPGSQIWTGELGQSLDKTIRLANNGVQEVGYGHDLYIDFQYWRSSSSSLVHRLDDDHFLPKYFESDVEIMTSTLLELCGSNDIIQVGTMKADAMAIFKEAREFEIQLRTLKPVYDFLWCKPVLENRGIQKLKHGFAFSDETMADRTPKLSVKSPAHTLSVDFITTPGVYKRGNNSGKNYDTKTCLIKMGVVCNAAELLTPSRASSTKAQEATQSKEAKTGGECNASVPAARGSKKTKSTSNSVNYEEEEDELDHSATAPQPSMVPNRQTRSRGLAKANNNATGGKSSTPSTPNTRGSTRGGKGRGAKGSKHDDSDGDFDPAHT